MLTTAIPDNSLF